MQTIENVHERGRWNTGETPEPQAFLNAEQRGASGPNGKPSMTIQQAGFHLIGGEPGWSAALGQGYTVSYAFRSTAPGTMPDDTAGFSRFNAAQIAQAERALLAWSDVANISFTRVGSGTGADAYSNAASILFANYASGASGAAAFANYPGDPSFGSASGDVWVNSSLSYNANPVAGGYGGLTLIHEIGHAIGLGHPGDYDAGEGGEITYAADAEYYEDSLQYTVMSYFDESDTGASFRNAYGAVPMLDDISAAQQEYGVNVTTRAGDTVYGFNATADRPWFSAASASAQLIFAIWDVGGVDTLDFSGFTQVQTIDLQAGHFSNVGGLTGNVAIAANVVIENAIGGSGGDTILGNAAANGLFGQAGSDSLSGGGGGDALTGGAGSDIFLYANAADSSAQASDFITDFQTSADLIDLRAVRPSEISLVRSGAATFVFVNTAGGAMTIAANGDVNGLDVLTHDSHGVYIVGDGAANIVAGGANGDVIQAGAGADVITGGGGGDVLFGEAGADTFRYLAAGDSTAAGPDGIYGFETGVDRIDLPSLTLSDLSLVRGGGSTFLFASTSGGAMQLATIGHDLNAGDLVLGQARGVFMLGDETADTLLGGAFNDVIQAGGGADTVRGGAGGDTLWGGAGADVFKYAAVGDSAGSGVDSIFDFQSGVDRLDLTGAHAGPGDAYGVLSSGGSTFVFVDLGGDGTNDMTIQLTNTAAIQSGDILF